MRDERAPGSWRTAAAVLRKDLLLELRGLETVPAMILFALVTFVIFHFGLGRDTIGGQLAAGVLTSHDPQAALAEADLVLGLQDGRAAFLTSPARLEPGALERLYA